ncbi:MAG TPA: hypothetical protein VKW76_06980 [Candidatus Binatia bacterium]|nr:hypothetical protein [Candidatus Binatia bacterium]
MKRGRVIMLAVLVGAGGLALLLARSGATGPQARTVRLEWLPSRSARVDAYVAWRCVGTPQSCRAPGDPSAPNSGWVRVAEFRASSACAGARCRGDVAGEVSRQASYVVTARAGSLESPPSNAMTVVGASDAWARIRDAGDHLLTAVEGGGHGG